MKRKPRRRATYSCERRRERKGRSAMGDDIIGRHGRVDGLGRCRDPCVWVVGQASPFYGSPSSRSNLPTPLNTMRSTRAPSPTLTSFSGISNYRTDPYKPLRDKSSLSSPSPDSYQVARTHYDELSKYLSSYLAKGSISSLSPFHSLTFIPFRTCKLSFNSTTETHEAYTPAVPGIIYRCLR